MINVRLETRDGGFVHKALIPPFNPPPESIMWGQRMFVRNDKKSERLYFFGDVEELVYTEGLCYFIK